MMMRRPDDDLQGDGEQREQDAPANEGRRPDQSPPAMLRHADLLRRPLCYIIWVGKRRRTPVARFFDAPCLMRRSFVETQDDCGIGRRKRSEEHTSELQSLRHV